MLAEKLDLRVHNLRACELDGHLYADLHLEMPASLSLREAHLRSSALVETSHKTFSTLPEMITHIEPMERRVPDDWPTREESEEIEEIAPQVASEWCDSFHKVSVRRMPASDTTQGEEGPSLSLHCQMDPGTPIEEAHHLTQQVDYALRARIPRLERVIIHMEPREPISDELPPASSLQQT